ncbi:acetylcholine receptor subunit beta-type unc-29-like [Ruditapes philippinarum]|uniref:acetylcholine receptor subunit beta-type unc-29-like n=1 Tax=Ruditapes philippinarum TaxID=129788 RepID=UPI00295BF688|nr:acetylcholine receptor subunit beta-type unc-29-like [Ruditapes philippinarum]
MKLFVQVTIVLPCVIFGVASLISNNTYNIHRTILDEYNADIRPCLDCTTPLYIEMAFNLASLNKLDEIEGELNTVGYVTISWMDERLKWDYQSTGVSSIMLSPKHVWTPPIILGNPSKSVSRLNADDALVRVMHNGKILWHPGDVFRSRCEFDVYNYPFDKQSCMIIFTPWSYSWKEISLKSSMQQIQTDFYHENGEWKLGTTNVSTYANGQISIIQFDINFVRRSEFFVVNVIVPIACLSFLNCLSFAIPIQSGERLSYSVTILLSFAVFMTLVSDNIPKTSAPMSLLCYFLMLLFSGSVMIMICVMVNMRVFYTDHASKISPAYIRFTKLLKCCTNEENSKSQHDKDNCIYYKNNINRSPSASISHLEQDPIEHVTWQDVSHAFDRLGFVIFLVYFIGLSAGMVLYISRAKF